MPRRSLLLIFGLSSVALIATTVAGVGPKPLVLLTTGCFVLVYALGTAAALRLLPKGTWARKSAFGALVAVSALLLMSGWYLLWPLVLAGGALLYLRWHDSRRPAVLVDQGNTPGIPGTRQASPSLNDAQDIGESISRQPATR